MRNTLDAITHARNEVHAVADSLSHLARGFHITGNTTVASRLDLEAEMLRAAVNPLGAAWNKDMDEQMSHGQAMMGNILKLALTCDITPRD